MVQKNYEYLTNTTLVNLKFGEIFNDLLRDRMETGQEKIVLKAADQVEKNKFAYELTLNKTGEMYYLNNIKTTLTNEKNESISHTFPLYKERGMNKTQMENLLQGRSVYQSFENKKGEQRAKWTTLDLKNKTENGNFEVNIKMDHQHDFRLIKELGNLPLAAMTVEQKEDLVLGLQKGYRMPVLMNKGGNIRETMNLEANPQKLKISVFDAKGLEVSMSKEKSKLSVINDDGSVKEIPATTQAMLAKANDKEQKQGRSQRAV